MLDTNVVSELMRPAPAAQVVTWLDGRPAAELWLTAMTAAELLTGVAGLPGGKRKQQLGARVGVLLIELFANRILPFDAPAAAAYAKIVTDRRAAGAPIGVADAVIAATSLAAGADAFATRKTVDFTGTGLALVDPWSARRS